MNISLIGPPGSGKGVQSELLSTATGLPHLSLGAILREHSRKNTALGRQARDYMQQGELVPAAIVANILLTRLGKKDARGGAIIDGFPRDIEQAELLDDKRSLDLVILLHVPDALIITRLSKRRQCETCGHIEIKGNMCSVCKGQLTRRADDQPRIIKKRLALYHETIRPIKQFYKKRGTLHVINGSRSITTVHRAIMKLVRQQGFSPAK